MRGEAMRAAPGDGDGDGDGDGEPDNGVRDGALHGALTARRRRLDRKPAPSLAVAMVFESEELLGLITSMVADDDLLAWASTGRALRGAQRARGPALRELRTRESLTCRCCVARVAEQGMDRCSACAFQFCVDHSDFNVCSACLKSVCGSCHESSKHLNEYIHVDDEDLCDCTKDAWVCNVCFAGEDEDKQLPHVFACAACPGVFCMACSGNTCGQQGCDNVCCAGCAAGGFVTKCDVCSRRACRKCREESDVGSHSTDAGHAKCPCGLLEMSVATSSGGG
eukprot:CAMPEP_0182914076 /NCGR_PEP_ID=MMETSP0034_2-20130328/38366_1 /TAXON_ID=156128 /ORGANISM="Nephroselmis pyriformis, Strain CCMP717" /LENGTH=280 /DNA_ID=CAMNT_0025050809 /DNA_START=110 /DNA_END=948 /DNA_ORIENTATION=-